MSTAFSILKIFGDLQIPWYGLLFTLGLASVWVLMRSSATQRGDISVQHIDQAMFWISVGAVAGGRLGEIILFEPRYYLQNPQEIIMLSKGGMSFHGGLVGVGVAIFSYALGSRLEVLRLGDIAASAAPSGLLLGRLGNFFNSELYGPPTNLPWGMVFRGAGVEPRHPTQLYEMLAEGGLLLLILYPLGLSRVSVNRPGLVLALFLVLYAVIRTAMEILRLDTWSITVFGVRITAAQLYCLPMFSVGLFLLWRGLSSREG